MTENLLHVTARRQRWARASVALLGTYLVGCGENINPRSADPAIMAPQASVQQSVPSASEGANSDIAPGRKAKSAVIFIGDGMGVSTVTAGRIHAGQKRGVDGESYTLSWEDFPEVALVKTYNYDAQVPDSAGTATAILSGYRARIGQVNVPPDAGSLAAGCNSDALPPTLLDLARAESLRVGIVSTARITHATPAAVFGHTPDRGWEVPSQVPDALRKAGCTSLGEQLADARVDLVMGGGRRLEQVVDFPFYNPIPDLGAITLPAMELYTDSHMSFEHDREEDEPSLAKMTEAAMKALDSDRGYILVVEAGRIDHAHHATNAYRALEDLVALDEAVAVAKRLAGEDTLIVVTADHGHVFTLQGYPARNNPILGLVHSFDEETRERLETHEIADDGRPYTTLAYANGPTPRDEVDFSKAGTPDFLHPSGFAKESETHSGEDVPLYATGAGSDLFGGVMDQPEVGKAIHAALGLDPQE